MTGQAGSCCPGASVAGSVAWGAGQSSLLSWVCCLSSMRLVQGTGQAAGRGNVPRPRSFVAPSGDWCAAWHAGQPASTRDMLVPNTQLPALHAHCQGFAEQQRPLEQGPQRERRRPRQGVLSLPAVGLLAGTGVRSAPRCCMRVRGTPAQQRCPGTWRSRRTTGTRSGEPARRPRWPTLRTRSRSSLRAPAPRAAPSADPGRVCAVLWQPVASVRQTVPNWSGTAPG